MTASARTWKYVGSQAPAGTLISDVLDAIYTLGVKSTYYDATARTPGSGVAGTWARKQVGGLTEAVYCNPVTNSHTIRWIYAGSASARTPTMISSPADTWATSTVLFGFSRSGSMLNATGNGWDQALPFDTGSAFSGFARALASTFVSTLVKVHLWECGDAFVVAFATASAVVQTVACVLDPGVTNATSPNSAEATSNGRYAWRVNGTTTADSSTGWTTSPATSQQAFFAHSTSANGAHCFVVTVGSAGLTAAERTMASMQQSDTTTQVNGDGDAVFVPLYLGADGGGNFFGRLPGMVVGPDAILGQVASASGVAKAYAVSTSPSAAADTLWLLA